MSGPRRRSSLTTEQLERPKRYLRLIGGNAEAAACTDREVLVESGAGTGKSYGLLIQAYGACSYPGARILFLRKTRKSLNVVLEDWEEQILGPGHPARAGSTAHFTGRDTPYRFPNGAEVWLGGLDNPDKWMSSKWDRIFVFEATDGVTEKDWQYLLTRLRSFKTPYHQLIADCNPRHKGHWLNRRANEPYQLPDDPELAKLLPPPRPGQTQITRILVRHQDNPLLWDNDKAEWTPEGVEYMATLHALKGADRERLLHHKWASQDGLVYPMWDADKHIVRARLERLEGLGWCIVDNCRPYESPRVLKPQRIHRFIVSGDKGFTHAGALHLYGLDEMGRMWLVRQAHHTGQQQSWWADWLYEWHQEFGIWRGWYEHDEEYIRKFNDRISAPVGRDGHRMIRKAHKSVLAGINEVQERLSADIDGLPGLCFLENSLVHAPDPVLEAAYKPVRVEDEMDRYIWEPVPDGKEIGKDKPVKEMDDGLDTTRYAVVGAYRKDKPREEEKKPVRNLYEQDADEVLGW